MEGFFFGLEQADRMSGQGQGTPVALRAWMWFVPVAMFVVAFVFGTIAALDERWGLLAMMVFIGVIAAAMLFFHWWILYRFGRSEGGE
jgi:hypothetical protein